VRALGDGRQRAQFLERRLRRRIGCNAGEMERHVEALTAVDAEIGHMLALQEHADHGLRSSKFARTTDVTDRVSKWSRQK
jgi:hypothetical protein